MIVKIKTRDFDSILDDWRIHSESEKWSLKTQFLRNHPDYYSLDDFVHFLEARFGKPNKPDKSPRRH